MCREIPNLNHSTVIAGILLDRKKKKRNVYGIFVGSYTVEADSTKMHAKKTSSFGVTCMSRIRTL